MMTPWAWLSYTIRPFDMLADRRRWFWQRPAPCARQIINKCSDPTCSICGTP